MGVGKGGEKKWEWGREEGVQGGGERGGSGRRGPINLSDILHSSSVIFPLREKGWGGRREKEEEGGEGD